MDDGRWKMEKGRRKKDKDKGQGVSFCETVSKNNQNDPEKWRFCKFFELRFLYVNFFAYLCPDFEVMPSKNQGNFLHRARLQPIVCGLKLAICVRFLNIETGTEY